MVPRGAHQPGARGAVLSGWGRGARESTDPGAPDAPASKTHDLAGDGGVRPGKANTRLVDLIFEAVAMKLEVTRCELRECERGLQRFALAYGCGIEDLPVLMARPVPPVSREDALVWCTELLRRGRLLDDIAHLAVLE